MLFSKEYIIENRDCNSYEQITSYSFMKKDKIHLFEILESEMSIQDKLYFLYQKCNLAIIVKERLTDMIFNFISQVHVDNYPDSEINTYADIHRVFDKDDLLRISNKIKTTRYIGFCTQHFSNIILNYTLMGLTKSIEEIEDNANWCSINAANIVYVLDKKNKNKNYELQLIELIKEFLK